MDFDRGGLIYYMPDIQFFGEERLFVENFNSAKTFAYVNKTDFSRGNIFGLNQHSVV